MLRSFQHLAKTFSRSLYPTGMLSCEALQKRTPSLSSMNFQRDMTRRAILASLRFSFRPTTATRSAGMEGETVKKFRIGPCENGSIAFHLAKIGRASCRERVCQYV